MKWLGIGWMVVVMGMGMGCSERPTRADMHPVDGPTKAETPAEQDEEQDEEHETNELREALLAMLGGYEQGPGVDALRGLGPSEEVVTGLLEIYGDESVHRHRRVQALMGLRFFPEDPRAVEAFEAALIDEATPASVRRRAVRVYGELRGEEAVELLGQMLVHEDEHTREMAAEALAEIGTDAAREMLGAGGVQ